MERHGRLQGQVKRLAVHHRQRAGQAERDRVGLRVGRQTEVGAAPREHLALGLKLNVDFQADDDFVVHEFHLIRRTTSSDVCQINFVIVARQNGRIT